MSRRLIPGSESGLILASVAGIIGLIALLVLVVPFALMTVWNWIGPSAGLPRMDLVVASCVVIVIAFVVKMVNRLFRRH